MVLIEVRNSQGVVGRCDARCYEANTRRCRCICGGVNHGKGLNSAIKATNNLYVEQILANTPGAKLDDQVIRPRVNPVLFDFALPGVKVNKQPPAVTHKTRRASEKALEIQTELIRRKLKKYSVTGEKS